MTFYGRARKEGVSGTSTPVWKRIFSCCFGNKKDDQSEKINHADKKKYGAADNDRFDGSDSETTEGPDSHIDMEDMKVAESEKRSSILDSMKELVVNNPAYKFQSSEKSFGKSEKSFGKTPPPKYHGVTSDEEIIQEENVEMQHAEVRNGFSDDEDRANRGPKINVNPNYVDQATLEYGDIRPKQDEGNVSVDPIGVKPYWTDKRMAKQMQDNLKFSEYDADTVHNLTEINDEKPKTTDCVDYYVKPYVGNVDLLYEYIEEKHLLKITVLQVYDLPDHERGAAKNIQVRTLLLPKRKQRNKTRVRNGEGEFNETFKFILSREAVIDTSLRIRVYVCQKMRSERLLGEAIARFSGVDLENPTEITYALDSRGSFGSGNDTQSLVYGGLPELLIGLSFNGTTGRLTCEVQSGSNFKDMGSSKPPDTYVKVTLLSGNQQQLVKSKTSVRRGQPNPPYQETFMFQVKPSMLTEVTIMIVVCDKKNKKSIGWFSIGKNCSGEEEVGHWQDMLGAKGEVVSRWHVLLDP